MATLWMVGMIGVGKSTVGPRVAYAVGADFVDLDQVIALRTGSDRARIIQEDGEEAYRALESQALDSIAGSPVVAACGDGVVEERANVDRMRSSGKVAWLDAPVGVLASRVGDGSGRPMLADGVSKRLAALQRRRKKMYEAAAHRRFDAATADPEEIAKEIVTWWRSFK